MIKFNAELMFEADLRPYRPVVERREPYIDIYLKLDKSGTEWPADLSEPGALIICRSDGEPIQYVVLDEGCDSEYRFTEREKELLHAYVRKERLIEKAQQLG
ncbi:hypothetical protein FE783_36985 [Paenibacillus mesophilus]|uniref:hypothetical protein n=1 Tax=Paenibacillus mesophilus TaxID=2582849 RepID=UPI00110F374B|nr:hypothetical protein [Paenibacillus mesophilus]TMV42753.1 hypothetical protein FE783_36985 [Paenibacillus mesophilus]